MPKAVLKSDEANLSLPYVAATRINYQDFNNETLHEFIKNHCIQQGKPLVVSNMHTCPSWKQEVFTLDNLKKCRGETELTLERGKEKVAAKLGDFVTSLQESYKLETSSDSTGYAGLNFRAKKIYAKDVLCPTEYKDAMTEFLPEYLHPHGSNDLFGSLPDRFKAENLMCYVGQDATGTPIHRDLCGTMGHNIMTMASPGGFAEWFVVEHQQRDQLAAVLAPNRSENKKHINRVQRQLLPPKSNKSTGQSRTKSSFMESDRAWLDHDEIVKNNLKVQVIVQRAGDLVIVPSRAYHQVRNHGVSVKIAWNRITPQTLAYAFEDQLPLYRIIGRPEVYKCKAIVAFTIRNWNSQLAHMCDLLRCNDASPEIIQQFPLLKYGVDVFLENAKIMLNLYLHKVLFPEMLYGDHNDGIISDGPGEICTVQCDFCHSDVFYRYYHCDQCEGYDLCLDCYAIGRSCQHVDEMQMHQSPDHIGSYIATYIEFVRNFNQLFSSQPIPDESQALLQGFKHQATNLATTCKRIEKYRKQTKRFNSLQCSHCFTPTTVNKLCQSGFSLSTIFQRGVCQSIQLENDDDDRIHSIYVCPQCTLNCNSCQPLDKNSESLDGYDLVYYLHPSHDARNWGGFIDFNVNKTCNYPKTTHVTYTPKTNYANTSSNNEKENFIPTSANTKTSKRKQLHLTNDTAVDQESSVPTPAKKKYRHTSSSSSNSHEDRPQRACKKRSYSVFFAPVV